MDIQERLEAERPALIEFVRKNASRELISFETPEDLAQEICVHVLDQPDKFVEDEKATFRTWLQRVATNLLIDRLRRMRALKRDGAKVLRFAGDASSGLNQIRDLAASVTGPSTFAVRREQVHLAARALDTLLDRDRWLVERQCTGFSVEEDAAELDLSADSTRAARSRAIERFRRAFRIVVQGLGAE